MKNVVGGKSDLVCVESKVEIELITGLQLSMENVMGDKSDLVCVEPKAEVENAQVCNLVRGEMSEMVTGVQLGMMNVVVVGA